MRERTVMKRIRFGRLRRREIGSLLIHVFRRMSADHCAQMAAGLSYTSLLALVPLATIGFAMFAAFPVFEAHRSSIRDFLLQNVLAGSIDNIDRSFATFLANAGELTTVGILALAITAVMLLVAIESALNAIFRVAQPRATANRILVYWAVLTLFPLLVGTSFSLSAYLFTSSQALEAIGADPTLLGRVARALPALMVVLAFATVYKIVPNRPVRWGNALLGGLVGGLLFASLRWGFGMYLLHFPSYQAIYGALATLPILMVWMYLSWLAVLIGASVAAAIPEWLAREKEVAMEPPEQVAAAIAVLGCLSRASRAGGPVSYDDLLESLKISDSACHQSLETLRSKGYVAATENEEGWVLARDPHSTTLYHLLCDLGLIAPSATGTDPDLDRILGNADKAVRAALDRPLGLLLADAPDDKGQPATD